MTRTTLDDPRLSRTAQKALIAHPDAAVRRGLAQHPNASVATLLALAEELPEVVAAHPRLAAAGEDELPELMHRGMLRVLLEPACPEALLLWAASHRSARWVVPGSPTVDDDTARAALAGPCSNEQSIFLQRACEAVHASRPNLSTERRAWLMETREGRQLLAAHPGTSAVELGEIIDRSDELDRMTVGWVAAHSNAPSELLVRMMSGPNRHHVYASPSAPVEVLRDHAFQRAPGLPAAAAAALLARDALSLEECKQLITSDEGVGLKLLREPRLPAEAARHALAHGSEALKLEALTSPHISADEAAEAAGIDESLLNGLARRTDLPPALLERLVAENRCTGPLLARPDLPPLDEARIRALTDVSAILHVVCTQKELSAALLATLATHESWRIRGRVAEHHATDAATLTRLAADPEPIVVGAVAENPNAPPEAMEAILFHGRSRTRRKLVSTDGVSPALLRILAEDPDEKVRVAAAKHPNLPADPMRWLAMDAEPRVRQAVARRADVPTELLERIAGEEGPEREVAKKALARRARKKIGVARAAGKSKAAR